MTLRGISKLTRTALRICASALHWGCWKTLGRAWSVRFSSRPFHRERQHFHIPQSLTSSEGIVPAPKPERLDDALHYSGLVLRLMAENNYKARLMSDPE